MLFAAVLTGCALWFVFMGDRKPDPFAACDQQTVVLTGSIVRKEIRESKTGQPSCVWYMKPDNMGHVTVQVYPADAGKRASGNGPGGGASGDGPEGGAAGAVPAIGKRVRVRGTIRCFAEATNPGEYDIRRHYRILGVDCRLTNAVITETSGRADIYREALFGLKSRLCGVTDACMDGADAGMMRAMLFGDRSAMDADLKRLYRDAALGHLYATSGLHCAAIGMMLFSLFGRLRIPRLIAVPVCIMLMVSYGIMCGMPLSAVRAVFMFSLRLSAPLLGRTFDMASACALIGILMLIEQPMYVQSAGFLLSFGAVAGICLLIPVVERLFPLPLSMREEADRMRRGSMKRLSVRIARGAYHALSSSLAVMLATLPVSMCFFNTVPVWSVFLNALAIPLAGILMTAGMAAVLAGSLYVPAGRLVAYVCRLILWFYRMLCEGGIRLPGHTWYAGRAAVWQVAAYYILLGILVWRVTALRTGNARGQGRPVAGAVRVQVQTQSVAGAVRVFSRLHLRYARMFSIIILVVAVAVLSVRLAPALQITFLDVGQGDGIVIRNGRHSYLIDCGSTSKSSAGEYCLLPYLKHEGIGFLDAVFVSHEDADHVNGITELLEDMSRGGIRVGALFLPDVGREEEIAGLCARSSGEQTGTSDDLYLSIVLQAHRLGIPVTYLRAGCRVRQGDLVFTCLAPVPDGAASAAENANAHSMVLHMRYLPGGDAAEHAGDATHPRGGYFRIDRKACFSALFTGDVEAEGLTGLNRTLASLPETMRDVDVLKVAHHGSRHTTDETFLSLIDAHLAVISCGRNNRYGHPHAELLDRLDADGMRVVTTAAHGAITVRIDRSGRMYAEAFIPAAETYLRQE